MQSVRADLPLTQAKKPPARSYVWTADEGTPNRGILTTTVGRVVTVYRLREIKTVQSPARAFALHKLSGGTDQEAAGYDVLIEPAGCRCECRGYLRHGHCTHIDAVSELCRNGEFDVKPEVCPECAGNRFIPTADVGAMPCPTCAAHPTASARDDEDDGLDQDEPTPLADEPGEYPRFRCPICLGEATLTDDPRTGEVEFFCLDCPIAFVPAGISDDYPESAA